MLLPASNLALFFFYLNTSYAASVAALGQSGQEQSLNTADGQASTGLSASAFATTAGARGEKIVYRTTVFGGPHGDPYDDLNYVNAASGHHRIARIIMAGCEPGDHVNLIGFGFRDNFVDSYDPVAYSYHGKRIVGQKLHQLDLYKIESIVQIEAATWKAKVGVKRKTRIGWIKFTTSKGASIECGSKSSSDPAVSFAPKDASLLYLSGLSGDAVDSFQGHFVDNKTW